MARDPFDSDRERAEAEGEDVVPLTPEPADADHEHDRAANLGYNVFGSPHLDRRDPPADIVSDKARHATRSDSIGPANEAVIGGEDAGEYDLAPDPDPPPEALRRARPKPTRVTDDRTCRTCGYALLGLPLDGRCPECGTPIAASQDSDLLRFASGDWLRKLALGCRLIWWGMLFSFLLGLILQFTTDNAILVSSVSFAGSIAVFAGTWLLTERDPSGRGDGRSGTLRVALRILAAFGLASAIAAFMASVPGVRPRLAELLLLAASVLWLPWIAGQATTAAYLGRLNRRVPEPFLVDRAHFVLWGIIGGASVLAGTILITVLVVLLDSTAGTGGGALAGGFCGACVTALAGLFLLIVMIIYLILLEQTAKAIDEQRAIGDSMMVQQEE